MRVPVLMQPTVGEAAAAFRERKPIAAARHSAAGAAVLATSVVAGVLALRVRVAGAVSAVVVDGEAVVVASAGGGSKCV
jgi:hypothetical protein